MTVRDLGYRAYEGTRLPPSHNTWVMLRHGLQRIWSSWVMKVIVIVAIFPSLVGALVGAGVETGVLSLFTGPEGAVDPNRANQWIDWFLCGQMWCWGSVISMAFGAGIIAGDFANKAFQYYFSKPVVAIQYLVGRAGALALMLFVVLFAPMLLIWVAFMATAAPDLRLERAGLLLPLVLQSALIALTLAAGAIGCSSLSKSRALTISAWILVFLVPHVIAWSVKNLTEWEWLYLASIPGMLDIVSESLFKVRPPEADVHWYHVAPVLFGVIVLGLWGASERVKRAEVIT